MVRQTQNEIGMFDACTTDIFSLRRQSVPGLTGVACWVQDIIWNGVAQAAGAKVAIMYSDSADRWLSPAITSQGAAKRSLYIMLKHMSLPTDVVTEDDCVEGHLNHYAALFVVDAQISEAAVGAIGSWANAGGRAFITAGGGMLNEYNMTNEAMAALLPVKQEGIWTGTENSRRNGALPPLLQALVAC